MHLFFKVFIEFVTILLLFYVLVFLAPRHVRSELPNQGLNPHPLQIGSRRLSHWITKEAPLFSFVPSKKQGTKLSKINKIFFSYLEKNQIPFINFFFFLRNEEILSASTVIVDSQIRKCDVTTCLSSWCEPMVYLTLLLPPLLLVNSTLLWPGVRKVIQIMLYSFLKKQALPSN